MKELSSLFLEHEWLALLMPILVQLTVVLLFALLTARVMNRTPARKQTVLRCGALAAVICPLVTLAFHVHQLAWFEVQLPRIGTSQDANPAVVSLPENGPFERDRDQVLDVDGSNSPSELSKPAVAEFTEDDRRIIAAALSDSKRQTEPLTIPLVEKDGPPVSGVEPTELPQRLLAEASAFPPLPALREPWPIASLLLGGWVFGATCYLMRVVRSWSLLQRLICRSRPVANVWMNVTLNEVCRELVLSSTPRLHISPDLNSPAAAGIRRPVVLLPECLDEDLTRDELRWVMTHEVAHIARRDHLGLLLENLFLAIFWFHPLAHRLIGALARAREEVCDNYVLRADTAPEYGAMLLRLMRTREKGPVVAGAIGLLNKQWKLEERISGLLDERRSTMVRSHITVTAITSLLLGLIILPIAGTRLSGDEIDDAVSSTSGVSKGEPPASPARSQSDLQSPSTPARKQTPVSNFDLSAAPATPQANVSNLAPAPTEFRKRNKPPAGDRIAAKVNGEVITINELADYLIKNHGKEHLESLVNKRILDQASKRARIVVTEKDIDEEVARTARKFRLADADAWYATLKKQRGISRDSYRQDIVWPTLVIKKLAGAKPVSMTFDELKSSARVKVTPTAFERSGTVLDAAPGRIAFVDIARIMRESPRIRAARDGLKNAVENADELAKTQQKDVQALQQVLKTLPVNKDNVEARRVLESLIAQKMSQHRQRIQAERKRFIERESTIYLDAYKEIFNEVRAHCKEHGIALALRHPGNGKEVSLAKALDPASVNSSNPQAVIQRLNQTVLYAQGASSGQLDITDAIIKRLNK